MGSYHQIQRQATDDFRRPSAPKKVHQISRHAWPRQFPRDGRKWRINQERDQRTMRAIAHFERGEGVWASLETILNELQVIEARRDAGDRMTWSRPTLCRSLARLESSGIMKPHGIRRRAGGRWETRRRSLHPEKLLPVSRECETRWKPECETQEVKDFELHNSKQTLCRVKGSREKPDEPDTPRPKTGRVAACAEVLSNEVKSRVKPQPNPCLEETSKPTQRTPEEVFLVAYRVLAWVYDPITAAALVCWVAYRALRGGTVPRSVRYYTKAAQELDYQRPDYQRQAMLEEAELRLLKVCPEARGLVEAIYGSEIYCAALRELGIEPPAVAPAVQPDVEPPKKRGRRRRPTFEGNNFDSPDPKPTPMGAPAVAPEQMHAQRSPLAAVREAPIACEVRVGTGPAISQRENHSSQWTDSQLAVYLRDCASRVRATVDHWTRIAYPCPLNLSEDIVDGPEEILESLAARVSDCDLTQIEEKLTELEGKMAAAIAEQAPADIQVAIRRETEKDLMPHRRKMKATTFGRLEEKHFRNKVFEHFGVPRLGLFYV